MNEHLHQSPLLGMSKQRAVEHRCEATRQRCVYPMVGAHVDERAHADAEVIFTTLSSL
jgi:hypothetical protein